MKAEGGGKRFAVRILVAIVVLLVLLAVVLGLALETASADPYGMATARPLTVSDVSKIEPLYGDVWTPNAAVSWSPDGRLVAVGGGFTAGVAILDAFSGRIVRTWSVPGDIYVLRWSPDGRRLAVGNELGFVQSPGWVYIYAPDGFLQDSWQAHSWFVGDSRGPRTGRRLLRPRTSGMQSGTSPPIAAFGWTRMRPHGAIAWTGPRTVTFSHLVRTRVHRSPTQPAMNGCTNLPVWNGTSEASHGLTPEPESRRRT